MDKEIKLYIVDAFTRTRYQGNPAGVVISPHPLIERDMFIIAGELKLETAFIWPLQSTRERARAGSTATYAICYYTHVARIPLCGHDTIATGIVLASRGEVTPSADRSAPSMVVFKSDIGDLPIQIMTDGAISMRQSLPQFDNPVDPKDVLTALGVPRARMTSHPARVVSTGTPFLFVGVDSTRTVDSIAPDMTVLTQTLLDLCGPSVMGVYVWSDDRAGRTQTLYSRCFAPGAGLPEDPVTGSASGALGCHLFELGMVRGAVDGTASMQTTQGRAMGRTGHAYVTLIVSERQINSVTVAGHGMIVAEGNLYL